MFYSGNILTKGELSVVWLAAHSGKRIKRSQALSTNIPDAVDVILAPHLVTSQQALTSTHLALQAASQSNNNASEEAQVPLALRLSGHLLLGVVKVYKEQVICLAEDAEGALGSLLVSTAVARQDNTDEAVSPRSSKRRAVKVSAQEHDTTATEASKRTHPAKPHIARRVQNYAGLEELVLTLGEMDEDEEFTDMRRAGQRNGLHGGRLLPIHDGDSTLLTPPPTRSKLASHTLPDAAGILARNPSMSGHAGTTLGNNTDGKNRAASGDARTASGLLHREEVFENAEGLHLDFEDNELTNDVWLLGNPAEPDQQQQQPHAGDRAGRQSAAGHQQHEVAPQVLPEIAEDEPAFEDVIEPADGPLHEPSGMPLPVDGRVTATGTKQATTIAQQLQLPLLPLASMVDAQKNDRGALTTTLPSMAVRALLENREPLLNPDRHHLVSAGRNTPVAGKGRTKNETSVRQVLMHASLLHAEQQHAAENAASVMMEGAALQLQLKRLLEPSMRRAPMPLVAPGLMSNHKNKNTGNMSNVHALTMASSLSPYLLTSLLGAGLLEVGSSGHRLKQLTEAAGLLQTTHLNIVAPSLEAVMQHAHGIMEQASEKQPMQAKDKTRKRKATAQRADSVQSLSEPEELADDHNNVEAATAAANAYKQEHAQASDAMMVHDDGQLGQHNEQEQQQVEEEEAAEEPITPDTMHADGFKLSGSGFRIEDPSADPVAAVAVGTDGLTDRTRKLLSQLRDLTMPAAHLQSPSKKAKTQQRASQASAKQVSVKDEVLPAAGLTSLAVDGTGKPLASGPIPAAGNRIASARVFVDLLVLQNRGYIKLSQAKPYADIMVAPEPLLHAAEVDLFVTGAVLTHGNAKAASHEVPAAPVTPGIAPLRSAMTPTKRKLAMAAA